MSSDGWDSPPSPSSGNSWSGDGWVSDSEANWGDLDDFGGTAPRPTPVASLWVAFALASVGLLLGIYGLVSTGFASEVLPASVVLMIIVGWLLSGICSVLALAVYQREELKRALSVFYRRNAIAVGLRTGALIAGTLGVLVTSYAFATWVARH